MIHQIEFEQNENHRKISNFNPRFKQSFEEYNHQKDYQFLRHSCVLTRDKFRIKSNDKKFQ